MKARKNRHNARWLRRRWRLIVAVVVVVAVAAVVVLDMSGYQFHTQSEPTSTHQFTYGVVLGSMLSSQTQSKRLAMLEQIKSYGFDEVRFNVDWDQVQSKNATDYNWKQTDAIMRDVKKSGLHMIVIVDRTPPWARSEGCKSSAYCLPNDINTFARFAGLAAKRYQHYGVSAWEVWNEPNILQFWPSLPNPNEYARMLDATHKAIKEQAPEATVLVGGLAGNSVDKNGSGFIDPRTFLGQLYEAGAGKSFDGIGYHAYTGPRLPGVANDYNGWYKLDTGKYTIRSIMIANGDKNKGVWLTEFGIPTGGRGEPVTDLSSKTSSKSDYVTADAQAQITQAAIKDLQNYPWVRNLDWYTYKDDTRAAISSGAAYGLLRQNGEPKPVLKVLQNAMR